MFSLARAQRPASGKADRHVQLASADAGASTKAINGEIVPPDGEGWKGKRKPVPLVAHSDAFGRATAFLALVIAGGHAWIAWEGASNPPKIDARTTVQVQMELPPGLIEAIRSSASGPRMGIPVTIAIPRNMLEQKKAVRIYWDTEGQVHFEPR